MLNHKAELSIRVDDQRILNVDFFYQTEENSKDFLLTAVRAWLEEQDTFEGDATDVGILLDLLVGYAKQGLANDQNWKRTLFASQVD